MLPESSNRSLLEVLQLISKPARLFGVLVLGGRRVPLQGEVRGRHGGVGSKERETQRGRRELRLGSSALITHPLLEPNCGKGNISSAQHTEQDHVATKTKTVAR